MAVKVIEKKHAPSGITIKEWAKYYLPNQSHEEVQRYVLDNVVDALDEMEAELRREHRQYEVLQERAGQRLDLLEQIKSLVDNSPAKYKETKELIKSIELAIENSYVEF